MTLAIGPDARANAVWRVSADVGRRYATVSGDVNPIHLSALAARALGFWGPSARQCPDALTGWRSDGWLGGSAVRTIPWLDRMAVTYAGSTDVDLATKTQA